jgi:hypothetical protein
LESTIDSLVKLVADLECDVFVHTWAEADMAEATWRAPEHFGQAAIDVVQSRLRPRGIITEVSDEALVRSRIRLQSGGERVGPITGSHFMVYGMTRAFDCLEEYSLSTGALYERVVRFRFDLLCSDLPALVSEAMTASDTVIMPAHNWARRLGGHFDGVMIASVSTYRAMMSDLLLQFDKGFRAMLPNERFVPEVMICELVRRKGFRVVESRSTIQLVRKQEIVEQTFAPHTPSLIRHLRECAIAHDVVESLIPHRHSSYLVRNWECNTAAWQRRLIAGIRRPVKALRDTLLRRT